MPIWITYDSSLSDASKHTLARMEEDTHSNAFNAKFLEGPIREVDGGLEGSIAGQTVFISHNTGYAFLNRKFQLETPDAFGFEHALVEQISHTGNFETVLDDGKYFTANLIAGMSEIELGGDIGDETEYTKLQNHLNLFLKDQGPNAIAALTTLGILKANGDTNDMMMNRFHIALHYLGGGVSGEKNAVSPVRFEDLVTLTQYWKAKGQDSGRFDLLSLKEIHALQRQVGDVRNIDLATLV